MEGTVEPKSNSCVTMTACLTSRRGRLVAATLVAGAPAVEADVAADEAGDAELADGGAEDGEVLAVGAVEGEVDDWDDDDAEGDCGADAMGIVEGLPGRLTTMARATPDAATSSSTTTLASWSLRMRHAEAGGVTVGVLGP